MVNREKRPTTTFIPVRIAEKISHEELVEPTEMIAMLNKKVVAYRRPKKSWKIQKSLRDSRPLNVA
jgi:hypothetical protein